MKKFLLIVLTAVLAGCLVLAACGEKAAPTVTTTQTATVTAPVKATHLTFADISGIGTSINQQGEYLFKRINEISGGQLVIDARWGPSVTEDTLDGVTKDTIDIALCTSGYTSSIVKDVAILGIPFCFFYKNEQDNKSPGEFNTLISDTMVKMHEPYNLRWLSIFPPSEGGFFMKKNQVKTPADLKGALLRTSGIYLGKLMTNWGASPASITGAEAASALQKGVIEGAFTGMEPAIMMGIPEFTPYISVLPYVDQIKQVYMSNKAWNRLNTEQQGFIKEAMAEWVQVATDMKVEYQKIIYDKLRGFGCNLYFMTKAEADAFRGDYYQAVQDEIRATNGDLGNHLCDLVNQFASQ